MSFYTSLNGMKNAQTSLGVIAHNISNSETYGFKRSRTEFSEIVAGSALTNPRMIQGIGSSVESITQNFSLGLLGASNFAHDVSSLFTQPCPSGPDPCSSPSSRCIRSWMT